MPCWQQALSFSCCLLYTSIRQQEGSGDITGWYDVAYKELEYDGMPCHYGKSDDTFIAWWEDADYSYAVTVTGINENDFINRCV